MRTGNETSLSPVIPTKLPKARLRFIPESSRVHDSDNPGPDVPFDDRANTDLVEFEFHLSVLPSQILKMSLWIWLAMGVENLEGASLFRVHDHVLYLSGCSFQCSHLSQSQPVVILSALLFEKPSKAPTPTTGK